MFKNIRQWLPLGILVFFYWMASSSVMPIIAVFLGSQGMGSALVGVLLALQALAPILFSIPCGIIADQVGHGRMILLGALGMLGSGLLFFLSLQLIWLVIPAQLVAGLAQMMVWLSAQTLIVNGVNTGNQLNRSISVHSTYMAVGQALGPLFGGFVVEHFGYGVNFLSYMGMGVVILLSSFLYYRRDREKPITIRKETGRMEKLLSLEFLVKSYLSGFHLLRRVDVLFIMFFTLMAAYILNQRSTFYPVFLEGEGWSISTVGMLISVGTIGSIVARSFVSLLLQRISAPALMSISLMVSICGMFLTPLYSHLYQLVLAAFFTGMALGLNQPLSLKMITEHTAAHERGLAMGLRIIANRSSSLVNPISFGLMSQLLGMPAAFYLTGTLLTLGLGVMVYRLWVCPVVRLNR